MKSLFFLLLALPSLSFAGAEGAFDGTQAITAEEENEAENYIHQGIAATKYEELCEGNEACTSEDAFKSNSWNTIDRMMPMVSQAYSAFSGLAATKTDRYVKENGEPVRVSEDGKSEYTWDKKSNNGQGGYVDGDKQAVSQENIEKSEKKSEEGMDYCGKLPMAVEAGAAALQTMNNDQNQQIAASAEPQAQQRAGFLALAKTHEDRSDSAKVQAGGWGAVAACYAVDMAAFGAKPNFGTIAKLSAATLISSFYLAKVKAHKDRADDLKKMANKLPGAGDCNPHTDTSCFCAEATSWAADPGNYSKYCVPPTLVREDGSKGFPCVDKNGKADASCKCKKSNSCISAQFASGIASLGLNPAAMKNPLAGISPLSNGHVGANLGQITEANLAMAKKALKDFKPSERLNIGSNPKAKKLAEDFFKAGIPKGAAAVLGKVASSSSGSSLPSSMSGASIKSSGQKYAAIPSYNKGKNKMESGGSVKGSKSSSRSVGNPFARRNSSNKKTSGVDIMEFSEKAQRAAASAAISKDKGRPIFEIITYRYKMRAWKEFKDEMQKNLEEEESSEKN